MKNALCKDKKEVLVKCKGVHIVNGEKVFCGEVGTNHTFYEVPTKNHGIIYMCPSCYNKKESYFTENNLVSNGEKKHGFTYSYEMELTRHDSNFVRMLQYNGFLPTYDSTVAIEYKSPIYQSLNGTRKLFRSLAKELNHDYFQYQCGTHCNIGHKEYINDKYIRIISNKYYLLFGNMSKWLELNPLASQEIYGRAIGGWASTIDENTNPFNHTNFINLEHSTHIEFRQCKFINENQYIDCVQLNTKIVQAIIKNFIQKYEEKDYNTKKFKNFNEYMNYKAKFTSNKIIQLLEKECDKKGIPYTSL